VQIQVTHGIDFYVPNGWNGGETLVLAPGESVLIPAGVKVEVPFGFALIFHNKSGIAVKRGLHVGADTVDHGYSGEVHVNLTNVSNKETSIAPGDKIIQGILLKVEAHVPMIVAEDNLYQDIAYVSERGAGGFGSTGTK
jgi:dUTP pyrophosphatase